MEAPEPGASPDEGWGLSDGELLAQWLNERDDDDGAASVAVFIRYRELVRTELERTGLVPLEAVKRVGTVFFIAHGSRPDIPDETPLRERLLAVAREVGNDPDWSPPL